MKNRALKRWWHGYVECRCTDGSGERFMNMCRYHGVELWDVRRPGGCDLCVFADDYKKLVPFARKTKVIPHIQKKKGRPFLIGKMIRDWTFYSGFLFFLGLLYVLSQFVWEICYIGQRSYSSQTLQKTVEAMDVYPGMKRSRLDCDAIEKEIREKYPDISWVSAEEKGSVLQISIKEGEKETEDVQTEKAYHITAKESGAVESIVASRGTAVVKKGDRVKKGQILIEGLVPVTDDSGEVVEKLPVAARGEVRMSVEKIYKKSLENIKNVKQYTGKRIAVYTVEAGNYSFSLKKPWKRLDNSKRYDIINSICINRTLHPFSSHFCIRKTEYIEYVWEKKTVTTEQIRQDGLRQYERLKYSLTEKGAELKSHEVVIRRQGDRWILYADISYQTAQTAVKPVTRQEMEEIKNGQSGTDP